jgi:hypothetical protein
VVTQAPAGGGLTSLEQSLVDHVTRGELLDLAADDEEIDEAAMRSWDESRTCRATVIRDILRGRLAADPDPHGLRLRGARITGRIDLENLTTDVGFELTDCFLKEGLVARDARLSFFSLARCRLEHPTEPALDGDRLTCSVLDLAETTIISHAEGGGAVRLSDAHIGGPLDCSGAEIHNDSGLALVADGLQVDQGVSLTGGFTATGTGDRGAVSLRSARIGLQFSCTGVELRNDSGPALDADNLKVGQGMYVRRGFVATGGGEDGAVRIAGAHIGGQLVCAGAELRNDTGPALRADNLQVGRDMHLIDGFTTTGAGEDGAVRIAGAHIGGQFVCAGAQLRNDTGPALIADSLQVGQAMALIGELTGGGRGEVWAAPRFPDS